MTSAWELISTERQGQAGRRAIVAKTFRMGGGVEPGETLAGGAARELTEETGYVPEELIYLGEMCYDGYFRLVIWLAAVSLWSLTSLRVLSQSPGPAARR